MGENIFDATRFVHVLVSLAGLTECSEYTNNYLPITDYA